MKKQQKLIITRKKLFVVNNKPVIKNNPFVNGKLTNEILVFRMIVSVEMMLIFAYF